MRGIRTEKGNCRFIFAGFVEMYKQISGKGYYAGRRSPWSNFLDGSGTLMRELMSAQAQQIIREGFNETLGFHFKRRPCRSALSSTRPAIRLLCRTSARNCTIT